MTQGACRIDVLEWRETTPSAAALFC
jgi:hypothetical protein